MPLIHIRDVLPFPAGDNASDTFIGGEHFSISTLSHFNYSYYSNETLSNWTHCYIAYEPYTPTYLFSNGSFQNTSSCYSPVKPIGVRSGGGIGFAVAFGLALVLTLMNLRKHGRLYLPSEKRFRPVGRRWQWYWMAAVSACAMISGLTGVDMDRYLVMQVPIVLENFFWFLMLPAILATVWESVRHWGSWQERQMIDPNPFSLRQDDKRSKIEFYLPLIFYFFNFMNFFMTIPRGWGKIEKQRSPQQTSAIAEPSATDGRFKAAAFFLFLAWLVVVYSLRHSIHYYKPRNRGALNSLAGGLRYTPWRFLLALPLSLATIGYVAASAFDWRISSLHYGAPVAWVFGLGWVPTLLIVVVYNVAGLLDPNEDRELIRQRRVRGAEIDREMGIVKKPHWWNRLYAGGDAANVHDQIAANVREVGGGAATTRGIEREIEMGNMPASKPRNYDNNNNNNNNNNNDYSNSGGASAAGLRLPKPETAVEREALRLASELLFSPPGTGQRGGPQGGTAGGNSGRGGAGGGGLGSTAEDAGRGRLGRPGTSERSTSIGTQASGLSLNAPPQQIKSMLDV